MATLDDLLDAGDRQRGKASTAGLEAVGYVRVGLWSAGWALARTVTLLLAAVAGMFFAAGWCCARVVPALKWARAAFVLGWEAGRPRGGARGPA